MLLGTRKIMPRSTLFNIKLCRNWYSNFLSCISCCSRKNWTLSYSAVILMSLWSQCEYFWEQVRRLQCCCLWFNMKTRKSRFVSCRAVAENLGIRASEMLAVLLAFIGYQSVSKISTKRAALKLITDDVVMNALSFFGSVKLLRDS